MTRINPVILRHYRERQHLSQEQLATKARLDKGTVARIERDRMKRNQDRVVEAIAKVLKVEPEQLTAVEIEGLESPREETLYPRSQLNVRVTPEVKNAFALVGARYGVSTLDLIEFAPLLFHLAASESLQARADRLGELRDARNAIEENSRKFGHLTERLCNDWQAEEIEQLEERSIASRDLRGSKIDEGDPHSEPRPLDYDEDEGNPFVLHLRSRCGALGEATSTDRIEGWYAHGGARYEICREEALAWFGGDEDAADDFVGGRFAINDMPKDVRNLNASERVAWVAQRRKENQERADAYFAALGLESLL